MSQLLLMGFEWANSKMNLKCLRWTLTDWIWLFWNGNGRKKVQLTWPKSTNPYLFVWPIVHTVMTRPPMHCCIHFRCDCVTTIACSSTYCHSNSVAIYCYCLLYQLFDSCWSCCCRQPWRFQWNFVDFPLLLCAAMSKLMNEWLNDRSLSLSVSSSWGGEWIERRRRRRLNWHNFDNFLVACFYGLCIVVGESETESIWNTDERIETQCDAIAPEFMETAGQYDTDYSYLFMHSMPDTLSLGF